ncbi:MAG: lysophospholipid acyltransferase family protein [Fidelibacterota bacterium]
MIRTGFFIIVHVLATGLLGIVVLIISPFDFRGRLIGGVVRLWARILVAASGVVTRVRGLENLDPKRHYFFACNHESAFDIPLALGGLPYHAVPVAKKELKKIPVMGWAMSRAKHIFVDRRDYRKAMETLEEARESLRKYPRSVLIFPEGTRSRDGEIHPFKKGGLGLAIDLDMPVVPVAICGTARVLPPRSLMIRKGKVELRVGSPIDTEPWRDRNRSDFANTVRQEVLALRKAWLSERGETSREVPE